ncbi:MAG: sulfur carrier protein ThiS [Kiritimatiellae bacterium]|nr:sulfur carrier protein ThiS [Kiritimatiellia bacterium]
MNTITVNGKEYPQSESRSLMAVFNELEITPKQMAVELNGEIIPRDALENTPINAGDTIEIIQFVGGG